MDGMLSCGATFCAQQLTRPFVYFPVHVTWGASGLLSPPRGTPQLVPTLLGQENLNQASSCGGHRRTPWSHFASITSWLFQVKFYFLGVPFRQGSDVFVEILFVGIWMTKLLLPSPASQVSMWKLRSVAILWISSPKILHFQSDGDKLVCICWPFTNAHT